MFSQSRRKFTMKCFSTEREENIIIFIYNKLFVPRSEQTKQWMRSLLSEVDAAVLEHSRVRHFWEAIR